MNEPFVKVITQTMGVLSAGTDRDLNIGVVINSDTGPVEITKVNNQNEFIDLYLSNNQLLPSDDVTVKHAYKLLRYTPLYITRASDNSVLCGLTSNGSLIYTNKNYKSFKTSTQFSIEPGSISLTDAYIVVMRDGKNMLIYESTTEPNTIANIDREVLQVYGTNLNIALTMDNPGATGNTRTWSKIMPSGQKYVLAYVSSKWDLRIEGSDTAIATASGTDPWEVTWTGNNVQVSKSVIQINNATAGYFNFFTAVNSYGTTKHIDKILNSTITNGDNISVVYNGLYNIIESNSNDYFSYSYTKSSVSTIAFTNSSANINNSMYVEINGNSYYYVGNGSNPNNYPGNPVAITPYNGNKTSYSSTMSSNLYFTYIIDNLINDISNPPFEDKTTYNLTVSALTNCVIFGDDASTLTNSTTSIVCSNNNQVVNNLGVILTIQGTKIIVYIDGTDVSEYNISEYIFVKLQDVHTAGLFLARISEILSSDNYISKTDPISSFVLSQNLGTITFARTTANVLYLTSNLTFEKASTVTNEILSAPTTVSQDNTIYTFLGNDNLISNAIYDNVTIVLKMDDLYTASTNRYLFYVGRNDTPVGPTDKLVQLSTEGLSYTQLINKLYVAINNIFNSVKLSNGFILFDLEPTYNYELSSNAGFEISISSKSYDTALNGSRIGIVSKFTNREKIDSFSISSTNDPEIFSITLNAGNKDNTYEFSMNPDKQSSSGVNIYYTYINELNKYFQIVELNSEKSLPSDFTSRLFGNEAPLAEPESDDYILAAYRFTVPNGVYYSFLFDCGYVNAAYASALCSYGQQIYAEAVISPEDTDDPDQIIRYRNAVSAGTGQVAWEGAMDAPWLSDNTVSDFYMTTSPGAEYIISVLNNVNSAKEFAPVYGKTNGTMSLQPKYTFTKDEREKMLDNQVNTIVWNPARNAAIKNLDLTLLKDSTYLSTRNNVRMVNAAAHICDEVMQNYHGWFSRVATWNNVTATLETELNARLMTNQQYGPARIRVICNETNNPVEVQEKNQLIVDVAFQFYNEIRWIYVYQKIYNLSENLDNLQ